MDLKDLIKRLSEDRDFEAKFKDLDSVEALMEVAAKEGYTITEKDIEALHRELEYIKTGSMELEDEELENVAGGWAWTVITKGMPLIAKGALCLKRNMRRDGSMIRCECGLHGYAVRK